MELTMNQAVLGVERSGIRVFTQLARQTPGCMALTLGEPDFDTAPAIRAAAKAALDQGDTHYPENNGRPWLKEAIVDFERRRNGLSYCPDEVIVTSGATEGIFTALFAILNPGDEVIIPTPAFGLYEYIVQMCRAVPVKVPTERTGFQLTEEALRAALTPRTKAVILTSPNNPTGRVYSQATLEGLRQVLRDKPVFVLCDEVYRQLCYDGPCPAFSAFPELRDRIVVLQSFSKPYAMTGWRLGYLMADAPVVEQIQKVHQYSVVSVSAFTQQACVEALQYDNSREMETFRRRRDYVWGRLQAMGLEVEKPEGAFYLFPSIEKYGIPSGEFCTRMIREAGLALTPGSCFSAEGFVRISYCYSDDALKEGMDRLERFLQSL
ncbi:MAG: pyridoxal phosphate-dependent aminotransferase [Oscillospiraceae bacterium]|nr:pyridoxal phosphate-dependent aminotransferase [Oscillospiraceae bacterium]